jgi:hypothetical protein
MAVVRGWLARSIERAGSGTLDMIELCRAAGLPPPEFRQEHGQVMQILQSAASRRTTRSRKGGGQVRVRVRVMALAVGVAACVGGSVGSPSHQGGARRPACLPV